MKVAVTSMGETDASPVDQRFGRARYFILWDTETDTWTAHNNNQNLNAAQGAGIQAGQTVINLGAEAVITGHCGPKAFATLQAGDVTVYQNVTGSVREAVEAFKNGQLETSGSANVDSGFGSM